MSWVALQVFAGTRVPIETLFDYLKAGESVDEFFRGVSYSDQGAGRWASWKKWANS